MFSYSTLRPSGVLDPNPSLVEIDLDQENTDVSRQLGYIRADRRGFQARALLNLAGISMVLTASAHGQYEMFTADVKSASIGNFVNYYEDAGPAAVLALLALKRRGDRYVSNMAFANELGGVEDEIIAGTNGDAYVPLRLRTEQPSAESVVTDIRLPQLLSHGAIRITPT